jgi:hypothetical protein
MGIWTRRWEGQIVRSRRESRLAFQATLKVKTRSGAQEPPAFFFVGTTISDAAWPIGQTTYRKRRMANNDSQR